MSPFRRLLPVALAALAGPAAADDFTMKDGTTLEAQVLRDLGDRWEVRTASGPRTLAKDAVRKRDPRKTPWEEFEDKIRLLGDDDAEGFCLLGAWAREKKMEAEAVRAFRRALAADPESPRARTALGFTLIDGKWVAPAGERRAPEERGHPVEEPAPTAAEKALGTRLEKRQSEHYRIESTRLDPRAMGRYLDSLERAREAAYAFLGEVEPADPPRFTYVVLRDREEYLKTIAALVAPAVAPGGDDERQLRLERSHRLARMRGAPGALTCPFSESDETADRAYLAHFAVHEVWLSEAPVRTRVPNWLTEAVAYGVLNEMFPDDPAYCVTTGYGRSDRAADPWRNTRTWPGMARRLAVQNRALDFETLSNLDLNSLTFDALVQSWSILESLRAKDRNGTRAYLRQVRRGADPREALRAALKLDNAGVDRAWREFVLRQK